MPRLIATICAFIASALLAGNALAADLDPKIIAYTLPENIKWVDNAARTNQTAIITGDPNKTRPYYMLLKWKTGNMSRPHAQ